MKKIISLLLAVLLCAGIIPCTALADNELKIDNNYQFYCESALRFYDDFDVRATFLEIANR